jgi:hypothetical protein
MSHRVRLAALIAVSKSRCVRIANGNSNGNSRLVISSNWKYAATCRAVSRSACADWGHHIWHLAFEQEGSESYLPCSHLDFRFMKSVRLRPFFCPVRLPVPQHGLDAWPLIIGQPLSATIPSTLSQW